MHTRRQIRRPLTASLTACLAGVILLAGSSAAADAALPADIDGGLGYLYEFANPETATSFEAARLEKLMAFVLAERKAPASMEAHDGTFLDPMAFHEFYLARPLQDLLAYLHNPDIPPQVLTLGTLRYARWRTFDPRHPDVPDVAARLATLDSPIVIRGLEHEEIAPDPSSGAYYGYDMQRVLVAFRYGIHTIWLSLARQANRSEVGRKGYALDFDNTWHFIYTGEKGITRTGLGWVDSFMYDGFSCIFYVRSDADPDRTRVAAFKWLRAGWQDMNFVRYSHIRDGLERFGATMRQILENPHLPAPERLADVNRRITALSEDQLRRLNRRYLLALEEHYGETRHFPRRWFNKEVRNGGYVDSLTRPQLEAVAFLEYMKGALGMHPVTEPQALLAFLRQPEP
jgi:hypothetical protein